MSVCPECLKVDKLKNKAMHCLVLRCVATVEMSFHRSEFIKLCLDNRVWTKCGYRTCFLKHGLYRQTIIIQK